jgi:hypothetical protein
MHEVYTPTDGNILRKTSIACDIYFTIKLRNSDNTINCSYQFDGKFTNVYPQ